MCLLFISEIISFFFNLYPVSCCKLMCNFKLTLTHLYLLHKIYRFDCVHGRLVGTPIAHYSEIMRFLRYVQIYADYPRLESFLLVRFSMFLGVRCVNLN